MAGIGFRLRKILRTPSFASFLKAYAFAAVIGSGPLIMSIMALAFLSLTLAAMGRNDGVMLFFGSVTYVYCFTLILGGPFQLVLARYGADCEYSDRLEKVFPFLLATLAVVVPVAGVAGLVFFIGFVPAPLQFQLGAAFLSALTAAIWLVSGFLTAMKNYNIVLWCFGLGYGSGYVAAAVLTAVLDPSWIMPGFAIGHMVLFLGLIVAVYREMSGEADGEVELWPVFWKYRDLALCGLVYNVGIWIDKVLFWWFAPGRVELSGWIYAMPLHDQAVYLGFLSVIPGMAVFLLRLETEFALHNERFFKSVVNRASLDTLRKIKADMIRALTEELIQLVKVQGTVTIFLLVLAEKVMPTLGLGSLQTGVFQVVLLGTFLLVMFLSFLTILFYLDRRLDALACCVVFCAVNAGVTILNIAWGEAFYGLGYVVATAVALLVTGWRAHFHLQRLEYETFSFQPLYP